MKRIFTLFALCVFTGIFAQHKVADKVAEYKALNAQFNHFSILSVTNQPADSDVNRAVTKSTLGQIKTASVNDIVAHRYETIEVEVPYQGNIILVDLYKVNPFNESFHVDTDKAKNIDYTRGVYYRGIIKDNPNSVASFNFFDNQMNGIVSASEINNLVIGKLEKPNNVSDYIVYSDADMRVPNGFNCSVKDDNVHQDEKEPNANRNVQTERCVTMYFEIDNNIYQENNSDTTQTTNWMTSIFNNLQTLYSNDGITVSLKSLYIWTDQDPYEGVGGESTDYLNKFNAVRPVFDGDVGQLVGIDPGGLGGIAANIDGLCNESNYSYSDVYLQYSTVPVYSWTVQVCTHEMGHLLGSPHTHGCVWNGNNTAIDNCGPYALSGTVPPPEGTSCMTSPPTIPASNVKGTIMSYCHLISGVGISFNNGFGPQPSALINQTVEGSTCLSTDCINTCINTVVDIEVTNPTSTSATVTWSDLGTATSWQISYATFGSTVTNWTTVTSPTYIIPTTLASNVYYRVKIRPVCDSGITPNYREFVFATPAIWCNGIVITDTGGTVNNYTNDQHYVRTLIPNLPNKKIHLEFNQFDLEEDYDFLTIYNGPNTASDSFGGYTGTYIMSPIESSSPDGALTLEFYSDQGVVASGYSASVSCAQNLGVPGFTPDIDFTYYPNPSNGSVNIVSNTEMTEILIYNPQGRLLYQNKNNGLEKAVNISAFATGTYFFKVKFGEKEANFKIVKN